MQQNLSPACGFSVSFMLPFFSWSQCLFLSLSSDPITVFKKTKEKKKHFCPMFVKNQIPSKIFDIWLSSLSNCKLDFKKTGFQQKLQAFLIKKICHVNVKNVTTSYLSSNTESSIQPESKEQRKETFWVQASLSVIQFFSLLHKPLVLTTVGDRTMKTFTFDWCIPVSVVFIYCACPC